MDNRTEASARLRAAKYSEHDDRIHYVVLNPFSGNHRTVLDLLAAEGIDQELIAEYRFGLEMTPL